MDSAKSTSPKRKADDNVVNDNTADENLKKAKQDSVTESDKLVANAELHVVTFGAAWIDEAANEGLTWGILSTYDPELREYKMFQDLPIIKKLPGYLQTINAGFLSHFSLSSFATASVTSKKPKAYWMSFENNRQPTPWTIRVKLSEKYIKAWEERNYKTMSKVVKYVRVVASGWDDDETVYVVPDEIPKEILESKVSV
jgi:hypothetical protein